MQSADGLSNTLPRKGSTTGRLTSSAFTLSPEETRVIKYANAQFERRGGFVRIFPAVDSWIKYSQYLGKWSKFWRIQLKKKLKFNNLDPTTGIPLSGNNNSISNYNLSCSHNFNLLLYTQLFPEVPIHSRSTERSVSRYGSSLDRKREPSTDSRVTTSHSRQNRYERMLSQGHRFALMPRKVPREARSAELKYQIIDLLRSGKKLT